MSALQARELVKRYRQRRILDADGPDALCASLLLHNSGGCRDSSSDG